ncbi:MAG: hypothetical protein RIB59_13990 [Rhodospirillales bacterium]
MGSEFITKPPAQKPPPPPPHPASALEFKQPVEPIGLPKVDPEYLRRFEAKKRELSGKPERQLIDLLEAQNVVDPERIARQGTGVVAEMLVTYEMIDEQTKKRMLEKGSGLDLPPDEITKREHDKIKKRIKDEQNLKTARERNTRSGRGGPVGFMRGNSGGPYIIPKPGLFPRDTLK